MRWDVFPAGGANSGLGEAGVLALIGLHQITVSIGTIEPTIDRLVDLEILRGFVSRGEEYFAAAQTRLNDEIRAEADEETNTDV